MRWPESDIILEVRVQTPPVLNWVKERRTRERGTGLNDGLVWGGSGKGEKREGRREKGRGKEREREGERGLTDWILYRAWFFFGPMRYTVASSDTKGDPQLPNGTIHIL